MAQIIVHHKKFGNGIFKNIFGKYIEVEFADGIKKFLFPNAFDNNMLETDDEWLKQKIETALINTEKQYHAQKKPSISATTPSSRKVVNEIEAFTTSFIGARSGYIAFNSDDELFEVIGYLAKPGRIAGIWAEIPNDYREIEFINLFPGQKYMPITQNTTTGEKPMKYAPQFRINLSDKSNCPKILESAIGKGLGTTVVGRINKSKFVVQLVHFFGFQFGNEQNLSIIKSKVSQYGYIESFNRGLKR